MNHVDIDPSLCTAEPLLDSLDDGFSPPVPSDTTTPQQPPTPTVPALGAKSAF